MKKIFGVNRHPLSVDLALLLLRLFVGVAFIQHGMMKLQLPGGIAGWAADSYPPFLQVLALISELGGGIALVLGLLLPLAMFGLLCTMAAAVNTHMSQGAVMVGQNSWELPGVYLVLAIFWILTGPGRYSLDRLIFGYRDGRTDMPHDSEEPDAL